MCYNTFWGEDFKYISNLVQKISSLKLSNRKYKFIRCLKTAITPFPRSEYTEGLLRCNQRFRIYDKASMCSANNDNSKHIFVVNRYNIERS